MVAVSPIRVLRKQMVSHRPSPSDRIDRKPIVLTDRDREILVDVHTHGFLTAELIEKVHFPDLDHDRRTRSSCCYDRLKLLWSWDYLARVEPPIARVLGGRRPYLYALGPRGVPAVQAQLGGDTLVRCRRLERLDDLFVEHDLRLGRFWAELKRTVRTSRLTEMMWESERELRTRHLRVRDPKDERRWLPFLPDAIADARYPDKTWQTCLVEVDMGTLSLRRFRRKVRAFEACLASGLFEKEFGGHVFYVVVLAPSWPRLIHLFRAAGAEVAKDRQQLYAFNTLERLEAAGLRAAKWARLDGTSEPLLDADAFDKPSQGDDR